jgi:hypothetical protein
VDLSNKWLAQIVESKVEAKEETPYDDDIFTLKKSVAAPPSQLEFDTEDITDSAGGQLRDERTLDGESAAVVLEAALEVEHHQSVEEGMPGDSFLDKYDHYELHANQC